MVSVQRSLTRVDGVTKAEISLHRAEAVITFDDAKTSVDALTRATAKAGFPSTVKK